MDKYRLYFAEKVNECVQILEAEARGRISVVKKSAEFYVIELLPYGDANSAWQYVGEA